MLIQTASPADATANLQGERWTWSQHWLDVLFLHWKVPPAWVQSLLPAALEVETHEAAAWVSTVLFRLKVRPRWLPPIPGFSSLTEINFRTYVRHNGKPGIYFLSMYADNAWAIRVAKLLTPLPYTYAQIDYRESRHGFCVQGDELSESETSISLTAIPNGEFRTSARGSLDEWLLERYRAFALDRRCRVLTAEVSHPPWLVRNVAISAVTGSDCPTFGPAPPRPPDAAHFSIGVQARFGPFMSSRREVDCLPSGR